MGRRCKPAADAARPRRSNSRISGSAFFAELIQQIHSFLASGVMSCHVANAAESRAKASLRSSGSSWTTPPEMLWSSIMRPPRYFRRM